LQSPNDWLSKFSSPTSGLCSNICQVKTNLGHSEAASGISSVIKATLALEHSYIPATIGVNRINPKIKTAEWNIEVVSEGRPWPSKKHSSSEKNVRRVSVNCFGYGGANAHAILENADFHLPYNYGRASRAAEALDTRKTFLLPFSAATKESLEGRIMDMANFNFDDISIPDLAYTLGVRRSHLVKRGYIIAKSKTLQDNMNLDSLRTLPKDIFNSPLRYAFIFTGQGAQWPQMGKELMDEFHIFRNSICEMDSVLQSLPHPPGWSLCDVIQESEATSMIGEATHAQPICTALQLGLIQLLASWDIMPSVVMGHSSGEIAAAFAAGYLSLAEAITSAYYRGYVIGKSVQYGAMVAVGVSKENADSAIKSEGLEKRICVACINSPKGVTISGDENAIDTMLKKFEASKDFARKLNTGRRAYHSHHMLTLGEEYQMLLEQAFERLCPSIKLPTGVQFISSVTGQPRFAGFGPDYWRSNLENPVLFVDAIRQLSKEGELHLIEVGPHSALELPIKQTRSDLGISEEKLPYSAAIIRGKDPVESVLSLVGRLFLHGNSISMGKVNSLNWMGRSGFLNNNYNVLHDLPPYRWHYDRVLWNECRPSLEFRHRKYPRHELLGSKRPGGHDLEWTWRNILRVEDAKWLSDHKLEDTIVFPGAGYIAMAIEAMVQTSGHPLDSGTTLRLQNVNILTALTLSTGPAAQVELFTTLRPTPITYTSNSKDWWEFNIVSSANGVTTAHATGSISIGSLPQPMQPKYQATAGTLEPSSTRTWYEKLIKEGLNFGKSFQSITEVHIPRLKSIRHCTTMAPLIQHSEGDDRSRPVYAIHPITIDAMLQTIIIAMTAGNIRDLRAKVPSRIGSAVIVIPDVSKTNVCSINANVKAVGFGAAEANAELLNQDGHVKVLLEGVRLAPYEAAAQMRSAEKRHPILRVLWKPDPYGLGLMQPDDFTSYLNDFAAKSHLEISDEGLIKFAATMNLISHKNPRLRILELGNDIKEVTQAILQVLLVDNAFKRLQSYATGRIDENNNLFGAALNLHSGVPMDFGSHEQISAQVFDLILLPNAAQADVYLGSRLEAIRCLLSHNGLLLALSRKPGDMFTGGTGLQSSQSSLSSGNGNIILARFPATQPSGSIFQEKTTVVIDQGMNALSEALLGKIFRATGQEVKRIAFKDVTACSIPPGAIVFSLLESEHPLLSVTTADQMRRIKFITDNASEIVWVTAGDLIKGKFPDHALASGLSRALMLEQPSLSFFTFDVDNIHQHTERTADSLISVLKQSPESLDYEFVQRYGVVHVSRFVPDDELNNHFSQKQGAEEKPETLGNAKPAQIAINMPGQFDSIYFKQIDLPECLQPYDIQVDVKAVGLNAKDFYALAGRVDTKDASCTLEYCGVVERVGIAVKSISPGDRVVAVAPGHFKTSEIVPEWACKKLRDDEDYNTMSTLSVAYTTALYALRTRAQIQPGESVLIHSAAGGVGIAAIQIAQLAGAQVGNPPHLLFLC
jgi:acyl transferase domain-containing protein